MVLNGNLDTRVRFERKSVTLDPDYGSEIVTWVPVATVWANVQDVPPSLRRDESERNGLLASTQRTRVRIRYRSDLDTSMRCIIHRPTAKTYQIVSGPAELGQHEYLEFMVEKYSTQGQ